jgi:hypothetical protein
MWQMILIYVIGIGAFLYMIWFLFIPRKNKSKCAGCPGAGSCKESKSKKPQV